jgi:glyoxylase-like metal-dependent hydrolase (beta-lactamase superfamily II)
MKEITSARVFAHGADAPYIDGRLPQPGPAQPEWLGDTLAPLRSLWSTTPVTVDVEVRDGEELPILGGTWLLHTPGHTPGSVSVFIPNEGLVIVGDVLSNTYGLSLPSRAFTVDMIKEINSIKRVADLEFDKACFGHGLPLIRKARQAIANFAEVIESKYESA